MTVKELIERLSTLDLEETIVFDYYTKGVLIGIAKEIAEGNETMTYYTLTEREAEEALKEVEDIIVNGYEYSDLKEDIENAVFQRMIYRP